MDKTPLLLALNLRERERERERDGLTLLVSSPIVALRTPRGFVGEDEMKEIQVYNQNGRTI